MSEQQDRAEFQDMMGFSEDYSGQYNEGRPAPIRARKPPVPKQLENIWEVNHAEPSSNLISNSYEGGTSYRVTESPEVTGDEYAKYYSKLFMREKNPVKLAEAMKQVPPEILRKTADIWKKVAQERGLLGEYYVTIKPFETCHEATKFFQAHCKTAKFIQKEAKCAGCVYNEGTRCGLMKKHLAEHIPYTEEISTVLTKRASEGGRLSKDMLTKLASLKNPKNKIQSLYLHKQAASSSTLNNITEQRGGVLESDTFIKYSADTDSGVVKLLTSAIKKGASYDKIVTKVGSHLEATKVKALMKQAVKNVSPINTVKYMDCSDELKGKVSLLIKDASCQDCVFYAGDKCNKFKVAFVNTKKDTVVSDLSDKVKDAEVKSEGHMANFFAKCINSGVSYRQISGAFKGRMKQASFNACVDRAVQTASKLSAYKFCNCNEDYLEKAAQLYRDENCTGCFFNGGSQCNKLKKAFRNPAIVETEGYHEAEVALPMVTDHPDIKKASRLLDKGVAEHVALTVLGNGGKTSQHIRETMKTAITKQGFINAVSWNECKQSKYIDGAPALLKTATCLTCNDNRQHKCSRFGKMFVNAEEFGNTESVDASTSGYDEMQEVFGK